MLQQLPISMLGLVEKVSHNTEKMCTAISGDYQYKFLSVFNKTSDHNIFNIIASFKRYKNYIV